MKKEKKTIYTLCINNYGQNVCDITFPFIKRWANKIDAEFYIITERKFPEYLEVYEKMQIYKLGKEMENDWNIFIDNDTLIHPDMLDLTNHYPKDTVGHHLHDPASLRWKYNEYMKRDGRHIGACNWFAIASSLCLDFWHPLEDMTQDEVTNNISPLVVELEKGITPVRLIDDYVMSLNIARFGLKYKCVKETMEKLGLNSGNFLVHDYGIPEEQKIVQLKKMISDWGVSSYAFPS
jgi:hypothetical protein